MTLHLRGASGNNLKGVDLAIPSGLLTCVTGVSGSGKSTLINDTLFSLAANEINGSSHPSPRARRSMAWTCSTRWWTSTSRRSAAPRPTRPPTPACSRRCANCSHRCPKRVRAATPGRFSFNVRVAAAKPARATA
jgi:excinuclease ABC subunit A